MKRSRVISTAVAVFLGFTLLILLTSGTFVTIDAGERGVIFRPLGSGLDKENIYSPGFHIVAPWNTMSVYNVREITKEFSNENTKSRNENAMKVLSAEGLDIIIDVTVRFNPKYEKVGYLHEKFGLDYINSLVIPEVRSSVRKIIGKFKADELYSSKRDTITQLISSDIETALDANYVDLRAVLIRDITLPEKVKSAIEDKQEAEQAALKYEFLLQKAESEKTRQRIEAEGKAEANRILSASLTDKILTEKGIQATLELAGSTNSKVIVVGSGESGLPLILGNQ